MTVDDLDDHPIHTERYEVAGAAWERIRGAERVLAVGTTTVRVLESLAARSATCGADGSPDHARASSSAAPMRC